MENGFLGRRTKGRERLMGSCPADGGTHKRAGGVNGKSGALV